MFADGLSTNSAKKNTDKSLSFAEQPLLTNANKASNQIFEFISLRTLYEVIAKKAYKNERYMPYKMEENLRIIDRYDLDEDYIGRVHRISKKDFNALLNIVMGIFTAEYDLKKETIKIGVFLDSDREHKETILKFFNCPCELPISREKIQTEAIPFAKQFGCSISGTTDDSFIILHIPAEKAGQREVKEKASQ